MILPLIVCQAGELASASAGVAISNEFVRIRVNPGPQEAGRFAVDTTGGDPSRTSDDNQVLIYGSREPWTSFTTVMVDGKPFVFGGPTSRRAGLGASVGEVVQPPRVEGDATAERGSAASRVVCAVRFGDVEVTQQLGFSRNPTTRVKDAAQIIYEITNRGQSPHSVGLRTVLDTMLGANDGAPLRAGAKAITTATRLVGQEIPDYWQAFDSLSQPAVISQGTLRGDGLTAPDRVEMVDWGTLADSPWEFPFPEGADFTRRGEQEQDTAVALYWDPRPLNPGETRTYATLYGVGGVSLSPAQLSLGLTAPAEVDYQYEDMKPFLIVAYVENSGGFESRGTVCALDLPRGLKLAEGLPAGRMEGEAKARLGLLKPGETKQVSWKALPTGEAGGSLKIAASVTSDNLEPNRVVREIVVNSPPRISLAVTAPYRLQVTEDNRYSPNPFEVKVVATNRGAQVGRNLVITLQLPEGLQLERGESAILFRERFEPGQTETLSWRVRALGLPTGDLAVKVKAAAAGAKPVEATSAISVPELTPEFRVYPQRQTVPAITDGKPTLIPIAVKLAPARQLLACRVTVSYDPAVLEPLYVSRGEAFVDAGRLLSPWSEGRREEGRIIEIGGERQAAPLLSAPETTLFTIVFLARSAGETEVMLEPTSLLSSDRTEVPFRVVAGHVTVQTAEVSQ